MADRYQDRRIPADYGQGGGDQHGSGRGESDPLAELARLIGQTDPFGNLGRTTPPPAPPPLPTRAAPREPYPQQYPPEPPPFEDEPPAPSGPPPWMQRANAKVVPREAPRQIQREIQREVQREIPRQPPPLEDYQAPAHSLHRHARPAPPEEDYVEEPAYEEAEQELDPSRYDDALYGQIETGAQDYQREPAYPDDPYAYQDGYDEEADEQRKGRRGALLKVAALLALAVVGTGSALAYRTYVGSKGSGEPPIIKADNSPTKIVPAPADNTAKAPDRMPIGDGTEKLISREEAPVDINAKPGGPRVVFPPLNPNASPPSPSSVATNTMPPTSNGALPTNGTLPNNEPRKIRTFSVRGDQADSNAAAPVGAPPQAPPSTKPAASAKATSRAAAPSGNAPVSLAPDSAQAPAAPPTRVATTTNPPPAAPSAAASGGAFLVSVSSQQSETDAQNSYRALQNKFPTQLGSRSPMIKRTELGDKVVYRAMVGPFGTADEAKQFCVDYKAAGGQCFVPRN
jgi:SPOR domain